MIFCAFISSLSALLVYIPYYSGIVSIIMRIAVCVLSVLIAFGYISFREFSKKCGMLIILSLLFCGFFILIYQLLHPPNMAIINDIVYFEFDPLLMIALTAFIYIVMILIRKVFSERIKSTIVNLCFFYNDRNYVCLAKVDTACNVREPFSGSPVIIVEKSIFDTEPFEMKRVIPYQTLTGSSLMYAVKVQRVLIDQKEINKNIYIGSAEKIDENYQAIINSEIIR